MEWETLGKHCCAQFSCSQHQSVSVSGCSEKNCGKGVNTVSLVMISYSASPIGLQYRVGMCYGGQVSCFGLNSVNVRA